MTPLAKPRRIQVPEGRNGPNDEEAAILAAYFWLRGYSQKQCAEHADVGHRTVQEWVVAEWWPEACELARGRWVRSLRSQAQRTLYKGVKDDARLALAILERDESLRPPTHKHEHVTVGRLGQIATRLYNQLREILARHLSEEVTDNILGEVYDAWQLELRRSGD